MVQRPVFLTDALNRLLPFHLEWIDDAEAFSGMLKIRFRDVGLKKIEHGEFAVQDCRTGFDIDLSRPWRFCFHPGQEVSMSMLFTVLGSPNVISCSSCQQECI